MRYEIRPATAEDVDELVRMQIALQDSAVCMGTRMLRLSPDSMGRLYGYYRTQIAADGTCLLIATAERAAQAVGMGMGKIWVHADYVPPYSGELIDIWVEPGHRHQGIGGRIVRRLLDFFHLHRVEFLAVNYVQGNSSAEALWRRLGFRPVLITATAQRSEAMAAIGPVVSHVAPVVYRRSATAEQVVAVASLSV
ncbi:MAG TPA: GNAT family N-acetyltransferase [Sedimentisphaerales bacterium]|nr:GNAT family N-acetyltransferase [Sedimentisphaerales bacterium]HRS11154.1 GNAT family N-acetyltransferase [Sedimentisphaerales bacterium]HRV47637.1 GNAT family N-acetyltransferase [Sedimentisphaerales bacterium]